MKARSEVDAHYTLDTNWRSSPGDGGERQSAVYAPARPVSVCGHPVSAGQCRAAKSSVPALRVLDGEKQPAMNFWLTAGRRLQRQRIPAADGAALRRAYPRLAAGGPATAREALLGKGKEPRSAAGAGLGYHRAGAQPPRSHADSRRPEVSSISLPSISPTATACLTRRKRRRTAVAAAGRPGARAGEDAAQRAGHVAVCL